MIRRTLLATLATALLAVVGCSKSEAPGGTGPGAPPPAPAGPVKLTGAGATFPYPLYSKWMDEYRKLKPGVQINYQSIGSGGGIRQVIAGTVDFGATDAPMNDEEAKKAPHKLFHLPMTLGAVAVVYNVAELKAPLKLTPDVLVDIYLGKITKWNDARLKALNEGAALPAADIRVVSRSDGSGTTAVFTDYLGTVSPEWKEKVGVGKSVKWPVGLSAKGNEGVSGSVSTTPGSIGYAELAYALQTGLSMAALKSVVGEFVTPSIEAVTAAAEGVELPDSLHVSIVNSAAPKAYPISSYTYLLVYEDMPDAAKAQALSEFLWWAIHDGQKLSGTLHYAPLPAKAIGKIEARLKELKSGGKSLLGSP
ncbi:MAG: phosphate ABC transporter substrate-binding protein PstS [Polyangiaceae bacterium]|nr:phosphate ABC transporter substrate-binding protein PstS [Polyangiaceae bacterium]